MKEIQEKSIVVRVSKGSSYRESTVCVANGMQLFTFGKERRLSKGFLLKQEPY